MKVRKIILTIGDIKKVITDNSKKGIKRRANLFITANKEKINKNGINIKAIYDEKGDDGSVMENEGYYNLISLCKLALIGFLDI